MADRVYLMEDYRIHGVTAEAKKLGGEKSIVLTEQDAVTSPVQPADWKQNRILSAEGFSSFVPEAGAERLAVTDMGIVYLGEEAIDLRMRGRCRQHFFQLFYDV